MTPERWRRVKDLFDAALACEPAARASFLATAAGDHPGLADEVLELIASDEKAEAFLSGPVEAYDVGIRAGRRIGPYRVLAEMGRGGMGEVLRAVRDDDQYQKEVAIKLVRGGIGSDFAVERFKAERQILAGLEHANIARLIDGGATEEGWPWFAMELVEGQPIDQFCSSRGLAVRDRLELFRSVCSAVHHAHQRLVVHRDLKPANILVTAEGIPKLLDFGIAKLLGPEAGATRTAFPLMTPEYASPEQVKGEPITTATDVYSLGLLLYELLAGRRAYELSSRSAQEIAHAICVFEPSPPSAVASREVARKLAGDLDTIVLKAIRKEPSRRYASVQELSEDIRRHLTGLPVLARADTLGYRVAKFASRHRAGLTAAVLVLLSLVAGMAAALRQARIAEANRARAEKRFADVRKLANWVVFEMEPAISKLPGSTPTRKQLVAKAIDYLDGLTAEAAGDPGLEEEIAQSYERLAGVQGHPAYFNLGDVVGAVASERKAISLYERLAATGQDTHSIARLAKTQAGLVYMLAGAEQRDQLARTRSTLDRIPLREDEDVLLAWVSWFDAKGAIEADAWDLPSLRETRSQELAVMERLFALDRAKYRRGLSVVYKQYGSVVQELKEFEPARALFQKALEVDREAAEAEPLDPLRKLDLSFSYGSIGSLARARGNMDEALEAHQAALALREAVHAADPMNEFAFRGLVWAHKSVSLVLADKGDLEGSLAHEREVLRRRLAWEKEHPSKRGNAGWEASFHSSTADRQVQIASQPALAAARRREQWRRAHEGYSRALATWVELGKRAPLAEGPQQDPEGHEGDYTESPARLQQAIARCDQALARLGESVR